MDRGRELFSHIRLCDFARVLVNVLRVARGGLCRPRAHGSVQTVPCAAPGVSARQQLPAGGCGGHGTLRPPSPGHHLGTPSTTPRLSTTLTAQKGLAAVLGSESHEVGALRSNSPKGIAVSCWAASCSFGILLCGFQNDTLTAN